MNDKKKKTSLPRKEIAWYVFASFLAVVGLAFTVIGFLGVRLPVKSSDNWVLISEAAWLSNWSHMGYRYWGIILLAAGTLIGCTALTMFARSGDRDSERALRRAQRLAVTSEEEPVVKEVEVTSTEQLEAK